MSEIGVQKARKPIKVHLNYDIHTIAKQKSTTNKYVAIVQYGHTTITMTIQYTLQNKANYLRVTTNKESTHKIL